MPEFWTEAARMVISGLLVAAAAMLVALAALALRPKGELLLPPWQPWRVPWNGYEVAAAFFIMNVMPILVHEALTAGDFFRATYGANFPAPGAKDVDPALLQEANTIRGLWAQLLATPLSLGLLWLAARLLHANRPYTLAGRGSVAGKVAVAVLAWFAITPVVLVFHTAVNQLFTYFGVTPEEHALTRLGARPLLDRTLFVLEACIGAPLMEEVFFRGLLLAWCVGRARGTEVTPAARPWIVIFVAGVFAALPLAGGGGKGPLAFAGLLAVGLAILWKVKHTGARRARAVYATAAFFAVVHSGVWPSPIPLFALGLALGWLAVRTNGILVPILVHGLFNAVSAVFVLRS